MKTELDQENATILSLAKKLEISLGQQTKHNSNQFEMGIVKQLEDKVKLFFYLFTMSFFSLMGKTSLAHSKRCLISVCK